MATVRKAGDAGKMIPPLSQSRQGDMACELLYVHRHIECSSVAESEPAARGTEVHQLLATYINHLLTTRRSSDLEAFDALMEASRAGTREALGRFRENHGFDPEKVLATEVHIALDKDFRTIQDPDDRQEMAEYEGTLDLILLHSLTEAEIDDWKSYYQVIDADTFQSKLYPLLLMCLNPSLEHVTFVLEFIRYGVSRLVEYTRKDVPWLKELARRERTRQKVLHEAACSVGRQLKASPGKHCTWCPLMLKGCPVAESNPYAQISGEERLRLALWLQHAEKENTRVLKELMVESGPIHYQDGNQREYTAAFVPIEKRFYPYRDAVAILDDWFRTHGDEQELQDKLVISGLASPLKARKREILDAQLSAIAEVYIDTHVKIGPTEQEQTSVGERCSGRAVGG